MEDSKVIIYIILGVLYFLYTIGKRAEEKKKNTSSGDTHPVLKPVSAPVSNPMEDILREIKKKQAANEAQKKLSAPELKPVQTFQQPKPKKEILIHELKKATMAEGSSNYEPVYQREVTQEEKIHSKEIRLKNEGTYKVQTGEEAQAESDADSNFVYELDARQAFIGSVIFERKY